MRSGSTTKYLAYLYEASNTVEFAIYPTKRLDGRRKQLKEGKVRP
jgi:hypothetical protein